MYDQSDDDPWFTHARRLRGERVERDAAAELAAAEDRIRREQEEAVARRSRQEMQAAIEAAIPELTAYIARRGAAARELLAASGKQSFVIFGVESGGGFYHSVFFDQGGVRQHSGLTPSQGTMTRDSEPRQEDEPQPATVRQAVEYFARLGAGHGKPQRVRNIVRWFEREVERTVGIKRDDDE